MHTNAPEHAAHADADVVSVSISAASCGEPRYDRANTDGATSASTSRNMHAP
jgi:hypothetical protein